MSQTRQEELRTDPDDDGPRLRQARQWEDTGDPRGVFVRLQCELAKRASWDRERPALEAEIARTPPDPAWAAPLLAAGLKQPMLRPSEYYHYKPPWTFRRGFVEHLFAKADWFVAHGENVARELPIRSLAIDDLKVGNAGKLAKQGWLGTIEAISTTGPSRALVALFGSAELTGLRRLRLSVDAATLRKLLELPALGGLLALRLDVVDDLQAATIALRDCAPPTLEQLHLASEPGGWGSATGQRSSSVVPAGSGLAAMVRSSRLEHLRELTWDRGGGPELADAIAGLKRLERLDITDADAGEAAAMATSDALGKLKVLGLHLTDAVAKSLSRARFGALLELRLRSTIGQPGATQAGADELFESVSAPELRSLRVPAPEQRAHHAPTVNALARARLPKLVELCFPDVEADEKGIGALAEAGLLARLTTLTAGLSTTSSSRALSALLARAMPCLQRLSIGNTPADVKADIAVGELGASDSLPELRHLAFGRAVNEPSFGNAGARALLAGRQRHLTALYINATGLSAATKRAFAERFVVYPPVSWDWAHLPFVAAGHMSA